jgi:hypothetical protein
MSTVSENPTPACAPTAPDACPAPLAPVAPLRAEERPPRPSKSALLPEIVAVWARRCDGRFPARRIQRLTRAARLRQNVAITPLDKMFPPKVQDALFSPRIPDGGIAPMDMAL